MKVLSGGVKEWLNAGLGLLYPEVCQLCGGARATPAEGYVCGGCRAKVRFIQQPFCERCGRPYEGDITTRFECANCREMEWHFQSARSAVVARDPVLEVIHRYKYQRALWFEPFLAGLLIRAAGPALARAERGHDRAGAAASRETARAGIQPGRTPGRPAGRRDADSREHSGCCGASCRRARRRC